MKFSPTSAWRLALLVYLLAVSYICFASSDGLPQIKEWNFFIPFDKAVHFAMFCPFPILAYTATGRSGGRLRLGGRGDVTVLLIVTVAGCAVAGATELIQKILPTRGEDIMDFIADCLGLLTGALLLALCSLFSSRKSKTR